MVEASQPIRSAVPHYRRGACQAAALTCFSGEILALDQNGCVSFDMLQPHRSQAQAILFYAFDVIIHRRRRLIHVPLETRRELLSDIAADLKTRTPLIGLVRYA